MCGICGYFNLNTSSLLDVMLARLHHRGPDDHGVYCEDGIGLGIRRLSIIDVAGGKQPCANENESIQVVFNGEIYNFAELRGDLEKKGHRFRNRSDTEVIPHLYEEYGEDFPCRLRGMFAIALWDVTKKRLYLVRDRFGIKPLYFYNLSPGMVFASELPALRAAVPALAINHQALARYLRFGYVPRPDTVYEGVCQVQPGEIMTVCFESRSVKRYFSMDQVVREAAAYPGEKNLIERFRTTFKETVAAHLVSDVPLGLLLSSGLDSGSILAMMRTLTAGQIKTFSIGYTNAADLGFNETEGSRALSGYFSAHHTEELLAPDITDLLDRVVEAMGEPFADASAIPTYLVTELAKRSVTVALSGIGGDELFGGYPRFLGIKAAASYRRLPKFVRSFTARTIAPLLPEAGTHRDHAARLKRFLNTGVFPIDRQYLHWITFQPNDWESRAYTGEVERAFSRDIETAGFRDIFNAWPAIDPADKAMGLDLQTYLVDDLLRMADRLSMWHSLELRVPFCDHELLALALQVPVSLRLKGWQLKSFMRRALDGILPRPILKQPKRGFMVPIARWLREDLRVMTHDLLSEESVKKRGYLNPAFVNFILKEHASGKRNFSDQIYALCVLELWLRKQGGSHWIN
jgi:asparagine synthase (glutamine-hydrolysing)